MVLPFHGFKLWYKKNSIIVLAGFLPAGCKNRDKTKIQTSSYYKIINI